MIGAAAADTITLDGEPPFRRPGGTPVFAERALRAVGAEPVTFVIEPPVDSRLVHDGTGTSQEIRSLANKVYLLMKVFEELLFTWEQIHVV